MAVDAPVLIAGGGLVGLSASMFLAQHGVPSLAIERLDEVSPLPRAAFFHMRTMEMFRSAGIEERVREGSRRDFVPEGAIVLMDSVAGRKLADIIGNLNDGVETVSPCRRLFLNQPNLEPILAERAREGGGRLLRGHDVSAIAQDEDGVRVTVRSTRDGSTRELRGSYLIAADGAHSTVRDRLGVEHDGRGVFSNSMTIYFSADLSPWLGDKPVSIVYVNNPTLGGFFRMNRASTSGFLVVNTLGDPKRDPVAAADAAVDRSEARLIELVRAAAGVPDLAVTIDGVSRWRATADVARRFRIGRVFLAGDAAHLMPPNGGFGGNTGIHDAHNLAWKLGLVLNGAAGPRLLDTYEAERRPAGRFTVDQAFARYVTRTAPWLAATQQTEPLAHDYDIEIGYLYRSTAVIREPGGPEGHADPRETRGLPGSRLPHVWLVRQGERCSSLDLIRGFLLIAGRRGGAWVAALRTVRDARRGLLLDGYVLGQDVLDANGSAAESFGIGDTGAILVRPDGFVAWRAPEARGDAVAALDEALSAILAR
jgi:2-polyprenyl-6-methoxyphenol hydroxylase-like FAD-dependent oxidoreductase